VSIEVGTRFSQIRPAMHMSFDPGLLKSWERRGS
jgi:hypothetical protein